MDFSEFSAIEDKLKKELDTARYRHTLGVAHTAVCLAMKYGYDINKAYLTGLLHDCAKAYKSKEQVSLAEKLGLEVSEAEKAHPQILHAKTGAYIAKNTYGIKDEDVLNAIRYHTTGKPGMNLLEKIIYVADYIEPNRSVMKRLDVIRKTAFEDIDAALLMILEDTVSYLNTKSPENVDEMTEKTYEYYLKERT